MCNNREAFETYTVLSPPTFIIAANNSSMIANGKGQVRLHTRVKGEERTVTLKDVLHVPSLIRNLFSMSAVTKDPNVSYYGKSALLEIRHKNKSVLEGHLHGKLLHIECTYAREEANSTIEQHLWHQRLGHPSDRQLRLLSNGAATGFPTMHVEGETKCTTCATSKSIRKAIPKETSNKVYTKGERFHSDLFGPVKSDASQRFYVTYTDEATRYRFISGLCRKSDTAGHLKSFLAHLKNQYGITPKRIRSDNGGEYTSKEYQQILRDQGIIHETTAPHTPQENGISERLNDEVMKIARALLQLSGLPEEFWIYAAYHAVYLINRKPCKANKDKTPYEVWQQSKPDISTLRTFGCYCEVLNQGHHSKIAPKTFPAIYLGHDPNTKGHYRLWNPRTKNLIISRNVHFFEGLTIKHLELPGQSTGDSTLLIPSGTHSGPFTTSEALKQITDEDYEPPEMEINGTEQSTPTLALPAPAPQAPPAQAAHDEVPQAQPTPPPSPGPVVPQALQTPPHSPEIPTPPQSPINSPAPQAQQPQHRGFHPPDPEPRRSRRRQLANQADDEVNIQYSHYVDDEFGLIVETYTEPTTIKGVQMAPDKEKWIEAMKVELAGLSKQRTLGKLQPAKQGAKILPTKWVLKVKLNPDKTINKYKARLVARGDQQREGIDFHDTYAPVARMTSLRIIFAIAAIRQQRVHQMDVVSAYLHGEMDTEVYIRQPDGFVNKDKPNQVHRLHKALYGLKQAGQLWNTHVNKYLLEIKFTRSQYDQCIYTKHDKDGDIIVGLYVDDFIYTGADTAVKKFEKEMVSKFEIKLLGLAKHVLGLQVIQTDEGISLTQDSYITRVLEEIGLLDAKPSPVPTTGGDMGIIAKGESSEPANGTLYLSLLGRCMYAATFTRPDITHAVSFLGRYSQAPTIHHLKMVKTLLRT